MDSKTQVERPVLKFAQRRTGESRPIFFLRGRQNALIVSGAMQATKDERS